MKDKILIFGGTSGIGYSICEILKKNNNCITISRKNKNKNKKHIELDLSKPVNTIEILKKSFNVKMKYHLIFSQRYRGDKLEEHINITITSVIKILSYFEKILSKGSSIIFILSQARKKILNNHDVGYHICHAAIENIIKFYAVKLGIYGVRVNGVATATIKKNTNRKYFNKKNNLTNLLKKLSPLKLIGDSKDVANCVEFLISPKSRYITGQVIAVDGGVDLISNENLASKLSDK
jgi:3-oxoacyl-[acyl-carrier protein] reductase